MNQNSPENIIYKNLTPITSCTELQIEPMNIEKQLFNLNNLKSHKRRRRTNGFLFNMNSVEQNKFSAAPVETEISNGSALTMKLRLYKGAKLQSNIPCEMTLITQFCLRFMVSCYWFGVVWLSLACCAHARTYVVYYYKIVDDGGKYSIQGPRIYSASFAWG